MINLANTGRISLELVYFGDFHEQQAQCVQTQYIGFANGRAAIHLTGDRRTRGEQSTLFRTFSAHSFLSRSPGECSLQALELQGSNMHLHSRRSNVTLPRTSSGSFRYLATCASSENPYQFKKLGEPLQGNCIDWIFLETNPQLT